jgi:FixJ family two-component response regulator
VNAKPIVAIIDDDPSMLRGLVGLVRSAGHRAEGFASAEAFLARGSVERFACVITDIQMPGMSGIDLKKHLAAHGLSTPVILITARNDKTLKEWALADGAVCLLHKPFKPDALIGCLQRALKI